MLLKMMLIIDNNQSLLRRVKRQFNMSEIVSTVSNDENESIDIRSSSKQVDWIV